jgi:hypothetical protein
MKKEDKSKQKNEINGVRKYEEELAEKFSVLWDLAQKRYEGTDKSSTNANNPADLSEIEAILFSGYADFIKQCRKIKKAVLKTKKQAYLPYLLIMQKMQITAFGFISFDKHDEEYKMKFTLMHKSLRDSNKAIYKLMSVPVIKTPENVFGF